MRRIILACALAGILGVPAKAFDGTPSPNNPMPIVKPVPLDVPLGTVCGYAGVCLSPDLSAQANPSGAAGQGVDPLIGTWKMNPAKSTAVGPEIDKSQTLTYTKDGQNIVNNYETVDSKNQVFKGVLIHIYDGKPHSSTGSLDTNATAYTRMGNTISWVRLQNGKPVVVGQGVVDGNRYTVIQGGILANNQLCYQVYVFDKQ